MTVTRLWRLRWGFFLLIGSAACGNPDAPFPSQDEVAKLQGLWTTSRKPAPDKTNRFVLNADAVALGKRLFEDPLISSCGTVSCSSCHRKELGYSSGDGPALGCNDVPAARNPPSLLNVGYYAWYMWDGRADTLWGQATLPLTHPLEMNADASHLRSQLTAQYATEYQTIFGNLPADEADDKKLLAHFGKAIQAHLMTLNQLDSPFDTQVREFIALAGTPEAEKHPLFLGLKTYFRKGGCIACHQGQTLSDNHFHNVGVRDETEGRRGRAEIVAGLLDWDFRSNGAYSDDVNTPASIRLNNLATADLNEFEGGFKTPSLRNVDLTAPYMHTGEIKTLEEVIDFYDRGGDPEGSFVGTKTFTIKALHLTKEEKAALVDLLRTFTGVPSNP